MEEEREREGKKRKGENARRDYHEGSMTYMREISSRRRS